MARSSNDNLSSHGHGQGSTSASLLARVQADDSEAWSRLVKLYGPIVYHWGRQAGLQPNDAADVAQDVFRSVATHITQFAHNRPTDTFRGWLWTITRNRIRDLYRTRRRQIQAAGGTDAREQLEQLAERPPDRLSDSGRQELDAVRRRAMQLVSQEFDDRTWTMFWRTAVEGDRPADVAGDVGVTVWAVYKARSRVLQRLRTELEGLTE
jgi:RNA polymerase sigma-70 factor (ECF subfamily)